MSTPRNAKHRFAFAPKRAARRQRELFAEAADKSPPVWGETVWILSHLKRNTEPFIQAHVDLPEAYPPSLPFDLPRRCHAPCPF